MSWSVSLGRVFGSELRIHLTFFLLLAWVGFAAYSQLGPAAALENVLFILALFACVVAHEFGHALTARRYGIKTPDITLLPIGGLARLERMPENPVQEILVALAGPAVNVVIWAILVLFIGIGGSVDQFATLDDPHAGFAERLAAVNLILAVFNLIPAFPMDGGRVFRAVLSLFTDRVKATRMAALAGQLCALLLGFAGLSSGNAILILIAAFVFFAANAESSDVAMHAIARRMLARDAMITRFESLSPGDTVAEAEAALVRTTQHEFPVIDSSGALVGFVTRNAIFANKVAEGAGSVPITNLIESDIPRVGLADGLEKVLEALYSGAPAVAVCAADQHMIGYITRENIGEIMVLNGR